MITYTLIGSALGAVCPGSLRCTVGRGTNFTPVKISVNFDKTPRQSLNRDHPSEARARRAPDEPAERLCGRGKVVVPAT